MDHIKILKRAWETIWRYRALWIFGIILALTTASGGYNFSGRGGGGGGGGNGGFAPPGEFTMPEIPPRVVTILIVAGIALACVILLLIVVATVARYVAETALIRMVDHHEETGEKLSVRQGFRLGWSRTAFRLFLIGLVIGLPVAVLFILLFMLPVGLGLLSGLVGMKISPVIGVLGIVGAIGLFFLILVPVIIVGTALRALMHFFRRACALEELGVIEAIRQGFGVVSRHWQDVLIMWLIMIGVRIGWAIAMLVIVVALFPAIVLLIIVGGVLGGLPALLVWGVVSLFAEGTLPWILAAVVGLPIFVLVMALPWLFLGGLMEVFKSSVWTLTYRELRALEGLEVESTGAEPEELPESSD